ncbi:MAG: hypothetical protein ACJATA_001225 [Sphingobacteriales bacterium]|jgi:hypothetical protein
MSALRRALTITFSFLTLYLSAEAQELVSTLESNHVIEQAAIHQKRPTLKRGDTLNLPFFEDFSQQEGYPNPTRWTNDYVYVNNGFGVHMVSQGVATFEGLNQFGTPYMPGQATSKGGADTLTSAPLNMAFAEADSVFLSFFYQPQGNGEAPEATDSLVLQTKINDTTWLSVWRAKGKTLANFRTDSGFSQVMINLSQSKYLYNGFQFRFINYGNLSGNTDHWHVDYIRLNKGRSVVDTVLNDITIAGQPTQLFQIYTSKPVADFLEDDINTAIFLPFRNTFITPTFFSMTYEMNFEVDGTPYKFVNTEEIQSNDNDTTFFFLPPTFTIDKSQENLGIKMYFLIQDRNDAFSVNDSLVKTQILSNYYSYDDGTAENAYGLNTEGGQLAYKFDTRSPQKLEAIDIFFTRLLDNVNNDLFTLKVWKSLDSNPIYEKAVQRPEYNGQNEYFTYELDSAIDISGEFYVGWEQRFGRILNIGLDRNTSANATRLKFNVEGTWVSSTIQGSIMMRPVIAGNEFVGINENNFPSINIFPNPTTGVFSIENFEADVNLLKITNLFGKEVNFSIQGDHQIDIANLPKGVYLLQFFGDRPWTKKIIKQ